MKNNNLLSTISTRAKELEASKIRQIAELGMKQDNIIPLWFGEGSWPTSQSIVDAAKASLVAENFKYLPNNGAMNLREEICRYSNNLFNCSLVSENITVTPSGMQGLALTAQLLVTPGDRVVAIEPGWPNIQGAFNVAGASIESVALAPKNGKWTLDLNVLLERLTPQTKAVILNSPSNPTGWTLSADEQKIILDHCRTNEIWIVADDVYSRLYRHGTAAPSFLSLATPEDLLISVNSFSKCWSMTGWRLGWIVAPVALEAKLGQLTEFNTSCTAGFIQDAGLVAIRDGEQDVKQLKDRIEQGYSLVAEQLSTLERVEFIQPDGAFYCFFRVDGLTDSFEAAMHIMQETRVGLAPGIAFGSCGESYLRLCYAQPLSVLQQACDQLAPFLSSEA